MRQVFSILLPCIIFASVLVVSGQEPGLTGSGNSQILRAYEASNIVVGEVLYVGDPLGLRFSVEPLGTQTIVYKLVKVVKGQLRDKMFNVAVSVALSNKGNLRYFIAPGQKHILLLGKKDGSACNDLTVDPTTKLERTNSEFVKYSKLSCYFLDANSVIEASTKELEAVRVFGQKHFQTKKR